MNDYPERDYGRPLKGTVVGAPKVVEHLPRGVPAPCPRCGCSSLSQIEVQVEDQPGLKDGKGTGHYIGCPACPWASPMVTIGSK